MDLLVERFNRVKAYVTADGLGPLFVRSLAGSSIVRIASMVASFGVGVQLARGLGVEGYGYYGLAISVITISAIPGELGVPMLVTREVAAAAARKDYEHLFGVLAWARKLCRWIAVSAAIVVAIGAAIVYRTSSPILAGALLLGAPVIPLNAMAKVCAGALQGLKFVVLGQIPPNLLRPLILSLLLALVFALKWPLTPSIAMALTSCTAAFVFIVTYVLLKRRLPRKLVTQRVVLGHGWIKSSATMGLTDGMRLLQSELSILLVGLVADPSMVGLLRIANVTATVAAAAMLVVAQVAFPTLARLYAENDRNRLQEAVTGLARAQFLGVAALSLPLLLIPQELIRFAFGAAFVPASAALRILAIAQLISAGFGPNTVVLLVSHHEPRVARAMAGGLIVTATLLPPLIFEWGIVGAAAGLLVSMICWNLLAWNDANRLVGIETSIAPPRQQDRTKC